MLRCLRGGGRGGSGIGSAHLQASYHALVDRHDAGVATTYGEILQVVCNEAGGVDPRPYDVDRPDLQHETFLFRRHLLLPRYLHGPIHRHAVHGLFQACARRRHREAAARARVTACPNDLR